MDERTPHRFDSARRHGRRAGVVVFALIVAALTTVWSVQIILQVWGTPPVDGDVECRAGLTGLVEAVRRARNAAAAETGGERAALARFRQELQPEWQRRDELGTTCREHPALLRALKELDRLRYAEEHAVRYEAGDLAQRRRRVRSIERDLLQTPATEGTGEDLN
jgi:hypothetical protein